MDLLVIASLFVLATAVLTIGVLLVGIAADVRKTRLALEHLGTRSEASAHSEHEASKTTSDRRAADRPMPLIVDRRRDPASDIEARTPGLGGTGA